MGLKEAELLDPGAISETLKCPVCFEVFDDPVFCGGRPCQHVFCRECVERALEQGQQCPTCRAEMNQDDLHAHQAIRSLLDEVQVRCPRGCGWTGRHDAHPAHAEECPIARLEAASAELARYAEVGRQLAERDSRIAELEARVAEQDTQVVSVSRQLVAREVRIQELEAHVAKQEGVVVLLQRRLLEALGTEEGSPSGCIYAKSPMFPLASDEGSPEGQEDEPHSCDEPCPLESGDAGSGLELWL